ncbi:MAG: RNA polymerase sigma factor [Gaiellaceae bacterium]
MKAFETLTDEELLRRARRDPEAFCVFYDRQALRLLGWLRQETLNPAIAADLTAETFAQALRSLRRFRGEKEGSARAWLYRIAHRLLARQREKGRREARARQRLGMPIRDEDPFESIDNRVSIEPLQGQLRDGIDSLPPEQRQAVDLRVIDGLSYEEIAAKLECTSGAARTRVSRALRSLRNQFREEEGVS